MNLKMLQWFAVFFFSVALVSRFLPFYLVFWVGMVLCGSLLLVTLWTIGEVFDKDDVKNLCLSAIWMLDDIEE